MIADSTQAGGSPRKGCLADKPAKPQPAPRHPKNDPAPSPRDKNGSQYPQRHNDFKKPPGDQTGYRPRPEPKPKPGN